MSNTFQYHNQIRILQWNAKSILLRYNDLLKQSTLYNVFNISETWLLPRNKFCIKRFDTIRADRGLRRGGGVALLINQAFKYRKLDNIYNCNGKIEACAIEIFLSNETIVMVACYRPPDMPVIEVAEWLQFFNQFGNLKVILGGDFNAHNPSWGSSHLCRHGEALGNAILDSDLFVVGDGSPTFCGDSYRNSSVVDLTLVHNSICMRSSEKKSRKVGSDPWGSDHFPIFINLYLKPVPSFIKNNRPKLYSIHTNWEIFQSSVDENIKSLFKTDLETPVLYATFVSIIEKALIEATPGKECNGIGNSKVSKNYKTPSCPWWTAECDKWIRLRKAAWLRFKFSGSQSDLIKYRQQAAITRKALKKIKKDNFIAFSNSLRRDTNPKYIWKMIKNFDNRWNRSETDFSYSEAQSNNIKNQLDKLYPPWVPNLSKFPRMDLLIPFWIFFSR